MRTLYLTLGCIYIVVFKMLIIVPCCYEKMYAIRSHGVCGHRLYPNCACVGPRTLARFVIGRCVWQSVENPSELLRAKVVARPATEWRRIRYKSACNRARVSIARAYVYVGSAVSAAVPVSAGPDTGSGSRR